MGIFVGCNEDDTLDGATEVYITLNPTDIILRVGDTIKISALVTNLSGDRINTSVAWSVLDEKVAKILGDTAIVCVLGAQGKETKLKAELVNGKYALTSVTVTTNLPKGITPVNEEGLVISSKRSYDITHDSVLFAVSPKELLEDFTPQYTIEGLEEYKIPMTIDKEAGLVAIHYAAPRSAGEGKITVSIGEQATAQSASCSVLLMPVIYATFYGEKYADMPYLDTRPDKSVLPQWFAYTNETNMDINSEATIRVAMNIESGAKEDIEAAYKAYRWEVISGSSVVVTRMEEEFVENQGFDAVLTVRSGIDEGEAEFHCITPDTVLVATFTVQNYKTRYPVDEITVDRSSVSMSMGDVLMLTTGVVPSTSYAYHKPKVIAEDPTVVEVGKYDGNMITLKGLKVGTTKLVLTSSDKTLEIPVTITESIKSVLWESTNNRTLFVGQSVEWGVNVTTVSGGTNPYDVIWKSFDPSILTATPVEGSRGIITAIAEGTTTVRVEVNGVRSDAASVKVIGLQENLLYTSSNTDYENTVVYSDKDDLVILVTPESGYELIMITLAGVGKDDNYDGTYSVSDHQTDIEIDGAKVSATSGSVTIASRDTDALISFDLSFEVDNKTFTLKAENVLGVR
jgi:hypothetical protein